MANLDTTNKRRSATGIFHVYTIPENPDGADGWSNREQATMIYAGVQPQTSVPVPSEPVWVNAIMRGIDVNTGKYVYIIGQFKDLS